MQTILLSQWEGWVGQKPLSAEIWAKVAEASVLMCLGKTLESQQVLHRLGCGITYDTLGIKTFQNRPSGPPARWGQMSSVCTCSESQARLQS